MKIFDLFQNLEGFYHNGYLKICKNLKIDKNNRSANKNACSVRKNNYSEGI